MVKRALFLAGILVMAIFSQAFAQEDITVSTIMPSSETVSGNILRVKRGTIGPNWSTTSFMPDSAPIFTEGTLLVESRLVLGDQGLWDAWTAGINVGSTAGVGISIMASAVPLIFREVGNLNPTSLWRMPLDNGMLRYDANTSAALNFATVTVPLTMDNAGRVAINNQFNGTNGLYTFYVNGSIGVSGSAYKPGGGSWTATSDIRLKKNVKTIDNALEKMMKLRGVAYQWKEPAKHNNMEGIYMGMIAQEVEPLFPEWVATDSEGYKSLGFIGFEALTVESIKELKAENEVLKHRIEALEAKS